MDLKYTSKSLTARKNSIGSNENTKSKKTHSRKRRKHKRRSSRAKPLGKSSSSPESDQGADINSDKEGESDSDVSLNKAELTKTASSTKPDLSYTDGVNIVGAEEPKIDMKHNSNSTTKSKRSSHRSKDKNSKNKNSSKGAENIDTNPKAVTASVSSSKISKFTLPRVSQSGGHSSYINTSRLKPETSSYLNIHEVFNESVRWEYAKSDSEEEVERIKTYKLNRRKRYLAASNRKHAEWIYSSPSNTSMSSSNSNGYPPSRGNPLKTRPRAQETIMETTVQNRITNTSSEIMINC